MRHLHCTLATVLALLLPASAAFGTVLEIAVQHTFGGGPLLLDSLRYQAAAGETLSFTRLSYLLSGFALQREDGQWVELPGRYGWIDAEKRRTAVRLKGVPEGAYRALRFHVGLDGRTNASDPAQLPADEAVLCPVAAPFDGSGRRTQHRRPEAEMLAERESADG